MNVEGLSVTAQAKRGQHLPVVLSLPETAALLEAMRGTTWLMAALIYGGGLGVSECCELRQKDIDFDQGLIFVRSGKGDKDRARRCRPTPALASSVATISATQSCRRPSRPRSWRPRSTSRFLYTPCAIASRRTCC